MTIHDLRVAPSTEGLPVSLVITFKGICETGSCICTVHLDQKDKDGRPKCFVTNYEVLGTKLPEAQEMNNTVAELEYVQRGLRTISHHVMEICDNNGWKCWSY
jgi:hypothetical protein